MKGNENKILFYMYKYIHVYFMYAIIIIEQSKIANFIFFSLESVSSKSFFIDIVSWINHATHKDLWTNIFRVTFGRSITAVVVRVINLHSFVGHVTLENDYHWD